MMIITIIILIKLIIVVIIIEIKKIINNNNGGGKKKHFAMSANEELSEEHMTPVQRPANVRSTSTNIVCLQGVAAIVILILATTKSKSKIIKMKKVILLI